MAFDEVLRVNTCDSCRDVRLNHIEVQKIHRAGIAQMHWVGQKGVVLFVSNLGYTNSGSGQTIPPYSPLLFELELL